jgi:ubiquinone/menaquinone biosynthesis C-methylase UbiE
MNEASYRQLAAQLRQPTGEAGILTGEWMNRGNVHINIDTIKILDAKAGDQILEIGMGNGFFVHHIVEKDSSIQYTGADFSDVMIKEAERINAPWINNRQVRFVLSDVTTLPFNDNSFNKVFTINTIYFWEDAIKVLKEIKRVLQPKGRLIITLRPKWQMKNYPFTKYGFTMYSKEEVERLLNENGFTVLHANEIQEPDYELNGKNGKPDR